MANAVSPPPTFPDYTFIMGDSTTRTLACELAEALSLRDNTLYVDDFLAPIYEGFTAMFGANWGADYAKPSTGNKLMLPALNPDATENDMIVSLEKWFVGEFGESALGQMAVKRARDNRAGFNYPYLFRDATPKHIAPFLKLIAPRDLMFVWLTGIPWVGLEKAHHIAVPSQPTINFIVKQITEELSK